MLGKVQDELAKLIAQEIYNFAKRSGADIHKSLKSTELAPSGRGLPEPVLVMFEEAFLEVLNEHWLKGHGYAKWRVGRDEKKFEFLLSKNLISSIQKSRWSNAAIRTEQGVDQVQALGGNDKYEEAVNNAIPMLFELALKNICGEYHKQTNTSGWRVLTPVLVTKAAQEGTTNFVTSHLFYKSDGTKDETHKDLKLAKKLITGRWFHKPALPSAGPYLV